MKIRTVVVGGRPPALARSEKLHCERFACGVRVTSLRLALVAFYCVVSPLKPSLSTVHMLFPLHVWHHYCGILLGAKRYSWSVHDHFSFDIPLLLTTGWIVAISQREMINQSINHHTLPPTQPCDTS